MVLNRPDDTVITRHPLAVALVRCGVGGAIALADCGRAAARRRPHAGVPDWAALLVCPADPSGVSVASTSMLLARSSGERVVEARCLVRADSAHGH